MNFFQKKVLWKEKKVCEKAEGGRSKEEEGKTKEKGQYQRKVFPLQQRRPLEVELPYLPSHPEE